MTEPVFMNKTIHRCFPEFFGELFSEKKVIKSELSNIVKGEKSFVGGIMKQLGWKAKDTQEIFIA